MPQFQTCIFLYICKNHAKNIKAFIDAIDKGEKFDLDGAEGKKSVELILAIYRSAKEGKTIKFS